MTIANTELTLETYSGTAMPTLETDRLLIRRFTMADLPVVYQFYKDAGWIDASLTEVEGLAERQRWLEWVILNYDALANLYQPPYGDYAIVLKAENRVVGGVGLVQSMGPFGQLPYYHQQQLAADDGLNMPEFGLFWALLAGHQRKGYATEAAQAMIDYAFGQLNLKRIIATTEFDNENSIAVMRRLGMSIERNPRPEPEWFQVVGVLENPTLTTKRGNSFE